MTIFLIVPEGTGPEEFIGICDFINDNHTRAHFVLAHGFQVVETHEDIGDSKIIPQICRHCGTKYAGARIMRCAECGGEIIEEKRKEN